MLLAHAEPMRRPRRHVIAPDGTRIAWSSAGAGAPPILLTDGIGCAGFIWSRLAPALARRRRVLHWNYRGHGESMPPEDPERSTVDDCVSDLFAVLDAAGEERAVLAGHSMGVQVVLEAHRRAPGRVAGLVLVCGAPGRLLDTFHDSPVLRKALPWIRAAMDRWPAVARSAFRTLVTADVAMDYALAFEVNRALVRRDDLIPYFRDLSRVDPAVFVRLLASAAEHDATDHLPEIRVPALVVAGMRDGFTPLHLSSKMHESIPGSELLVLPGGTHVAPLEHPDLVEQRVSRFLEQRVPARRPARAAARGGRAAAREHPPRKAARSPTRSAPARRRAGNKRGAR
jgi:pimeloyl-ACP methyl ester carboxylesterase